METKKAKGRQGWWFAEVDGVALPCIHKHWLKNTSYHDPFKRHEGKGLDKKIDEAVDAMKSGRLVVLTDQNAILDDDGDVITMERKNYIAVFEVGDITYSQSDGLRLKLTRRVCNLE